MLVVQAEKGVMGRRLSAFISVFVVGPLLLGPARAADPWPADSGTQIWNGGEPSGIVWHERLDRLFWVHDNGYVYQMETDGTVEHTWTVGGDIEGVTIAQPATDYIYFALERSQILLREFDVNAGALTGYQWRFTEMEGHGNAGLEALTFVPNTAHPYAESASGGLFYAGLEYDGKIYVYDVDLSTDGSLALVDTITPTPAPSSVPLCGLSYHDETGVLYCLFRNASVLREMETDGTFIADYQLPSGCCYEGITLVASYPSTTTDLYIAYDNGPVRRYGSYPVSWTGTLTFTPEADTYIDSANPGTNYGSAPALLIDNDPYEYHTYLRFDISGLGGSPQSAALRMYCFDAGDTGEIRESADVTWAEGTPTWSSPLDESGSAVGSLVASGSGAWAEADVTSAVTGEGPVTFVVLPGGSDGLDFDSKEGTNPPELDVGWEVSPADLNWDGLVDTDDLSILVDEHWEETYPADLRVDVDRSGTVDTSDLGVMMGAWGP